MNIPELIHKAIAAREFAYAPFSNFCVGAALLTKSGKIYTGCNVENAGYSATNCAERTAFFRSGQRGRAQHAIAIVGGPRGPLTEYCSPCGVCRQVMAAPLRPGRVPGHPRQDTGGFEPFTLREMLPEGGFPAAPFCSFAAPAAALSTPPV